MIFWCFGHPPARGGGVGMSRGVLVLGEQLPTTLSVTVWEAGGQILSGGGSPAAAHYDTIHPEPPLITRCKHKQTDKRSRHFQCREMSNFSSGACYQRGFRTQPPILHTPACKLKQHRKWKWWRQTFTPKNTKAIFPLGLFTRESNHPFCIDLPEKNGHKVGNVS